jgi:cytochrome c oxidase cbb3-type subunit 3
MAEMRDQLTSHDYDGIQEFDNPTPGWWHAIFFVTIVFSVCYFWFYEFSPMAVNAHQRLERAEIANLRAQFAELGTLGQDEATVLKMMNDPKWLAFGNSVFRSNCVSCHGERGQGVVGSNLTDDHYKNVKKLGDVVRVVSGGAANGAMPAWKVNLHPNEVVLVSAYVASLRGKNEQGRGPEGDVIPAWPAR